MRFIIVVLALLVLGLAWTGGWYLVADKVSAQLDVVVERFERKQKEIRCGDRQTIGYPFRIGFSCDGFDYVDLESRHRFSARQLRTASQIYQPGKIVVEMESPGTVSISKEQFDTAWQSLRASVLADLDGPLRFSFHGRKVDLAGNPGNGDTIRISDFQLHGRKIGERDVDYALTAKGVSSALDKWTGFNTEIALKLNGAYDKLIAETDFRKVGRRYGLDGHLDSLFYTAENGGSLSASGPFSTNRNGLVSGNFDVTISDPVALADALKQVLPDYQNEISLFAAALEFMNVGPSGKISLPVNVLNGQIAIGLIPVADFPPVY